MSKEKGDQLFSQAEARLNKFSFFNKMAKYEDAAEIFKKAANQYKVSMSWPEAGQSFARAAECYMTLNQNFDAATSYQDAAACFKKNDLDKAIEYYQEAIAIYCDMGRFSAAAKLEKEIGELCESNSEEEKAIQHFQKAADYFNGEDSTSAANQCLLKVATFAANLEDYARSVDIFETVAQACLEKNVLKFNAKGHLFNAGIVRLCMGDPVGMKQQIERYKEMDYTFGSSRECKLLENLSQDVEDMNVDSYTDHIFEYDNISPLDPWKTSLLLRVKKTIAGDENADGEINLA
ncbi:hypothetical protein WA158_001110 [Blastocystis sp. Blastoise]